MGELKKLLVGLNEIAACFEPMGSLINALASAQAGCLPSHKGPIRLANFLLTVALVSRLVHDAMSEATQLFTVNQYELFDKLASEIDDCAANLMPCKGKAVQGLSVFALWPKVASFVGACHDMRNLVCSFVNTPNNSAKSSANISQYIDKTINSPSGLTQIQISRESGNRQKRAHALYWRRRESTAVPWSGQWSGPYLFPNATISTILDPLLKNFEQGGNAILLPFSQANFSAHKRLKPTISWCIHACAAKGKKGYAYIKFRF